MRVGTSARYGRGRLQSSLALAMLRDVGDNRQPDAVNCLHQFIHGDAVQPLSVGLVMRVSRLLVVLGLGVVMSACADAPTQPADVAGDGPAYSIVGNDLEGAIVLNKGNDTFAGSCSIARTITHEVTVVRNPNGRGKISCHWDSFPIAVAKALIMKDIPCSLDFFGFSVSTRSQFVLAPSGVANLTCQFDSIL